MDSIFWYRRFELNSNNFAKLYSHGLFTMFSSLFFGNRFPALSEAIKDFQSFFNFFKVFRFYLKMVNRMLQNYYNLPYNANIRVKKEVSCKFIHFNQWIIFFFFMNWKINSMKLESVSKWSKISNVC